MKDRGNLARGEVLSFDVSHGDSPISKTLVSAACLDAWTLPSTLVEFPYWNKVSDSVIMHKVPNRGRIMVPTAGWVVLLEAQPTNGDGAVGTSRLRRLLEHMPGLYPVALHSAERIAVQLHIDASDEVEALRLASADLRAGLSTVGLWDLAVVRAEVLTRPEYERDCRAGYGEDSASATVEVGKADGTGRAGSIRCSRGTASARAAAVARPLWGPSRFFS